MVLTYDEPSRSNRALNQMQCTAVRKRIEAKPRQAGPGVEPGKVYVSQALSSALAQAEKIATGMKDTFVSVEHLLLSLVEAQGTDVGRLVQ